MSNLPYAARAVQRGWFVFPVQPGEKTPHRIRPDAPYTIRWGEAATNDLKKVVEWWTYSPKANIGIACGPSGLVVLDADLPKTNSELTDTSWEFLYEELGPLVDGADVLRAMCTRFGDDYARLERTYRVCTSSLGLHLYFRWPDGVQASQASPVPGLVDVRGNGGQYGGYVLGEGSENAKGSYVAENDLPIADAPAWLVELCREKPKPARVKPHFSTASGQGGYSGLVDTVRHAADGNLNNSLLWAARSMCEDGATEEECVDLLAPVYVECDGRGGERQAMSTIRSAYRLQSGKK